MNSWIGIDVGGSSKGFHMVVLEGTGPLRITSVKQCKTSADLVEEISKLNQPEVIAIDVPFGWAVANRKSRKCEDELREGVCGIFNTPNTSSNGIGFYDWIRNGMLVYKALSQADHRCIEVFPTACWTQLHGKRGSSRRAAWSKQALSEHVPSVIAPGNLEKIKNQDFRDALIAAYTAVLYQEGRTRAFGLEMVDGNEGQIHVPLKR